MTQKLEALHLEALCEEVRSQGRKEGGREGRENVWLKVKPGHSKSESSHINTNLNL